MHSRHSAPKFTSGSSALFESAHTPALVIYVFVCVLVPYSYRTPTLWERRTNERQPCTRESPFCWLSCLKSKNAAAWLTLFLSRAPLFIIHVCVPHSNWQRGERKAKNSNYIALRTYVQHFSNACSISFKEFVFDKINQRHKATLLQGSLNSLYLKRLFRSVKKRFRWIA